MEKVRFLKKFLGTIMGVIMLFSIFGVNVSYAESYSSESEIPYWIQDYTGFNYETDSLLQTEKLNEISVYNETTGFTTLSIFPYDVKYQKSSGEIDYIDLSMKNVELLESVFYGYNFTNASNEFQIYYSSRATDCLNFNNDFSIGIIAQDKQISTAVLSSDNQTLIYLNAFGEGTRAEYSNVFNGVKENIVLNSPTGNNIFSYLFKSEEYVPVLSADQKEVYLKQKQTDEFRYTMSEAFAVDSSLTPRYSWDCFYEIVTVKDGYIINLIVSDDFLNDTDTVYPVTIDPTITINGTASAVSDTYIDAAAPTTNYYSTSYLRFGRASSGMRRMTLIKYDQIITSIPVNSEIVSAILKLTFRSGQTTAADGKCRMISSNWTDSTVTWSNQPTHDTAYTATSSHNNCSKYEFEIAPFVSNWYHGIYPNYGVMVEYNDTSIVDTNAVYSSESSVSYPILTITYKAMGGYADGLSNNTIYNIKNQGTSLYLDADQALNNDIIQYPYHGNANQQYRISFYANGYYQLFVMYTEYQGKCLAYDSTGYVYLADPSEGDVTLFRLVRNTDSSYRIIPKTANFKVLMPVSSNATAKILAHNWNKAANQNWIFTTAATNWHNSKAFSAFSVGNDTLEGYNLFKDTLYFTEINDKKYTPIMMHKYSNGPIAKADMINYLVYSEVAYIDGHGYTNTIPLYKNGNILYDNICLDTDIATEFLSGSTTKTNTPFIGETKWLIIQACSQLDYNASSSYNDNSALKWARALLGNGNRMHGVLGYYGKAPAGANAGVSMEAFLENQTSATASNMVNAWKDANPSRNWAAVFYQENIDDKLYWGWTANTSVTASPNIVRYARIPLLSWPAIDPMPVNSTGRDLESNSYEDNIAQENTVINLLSNEGKLTKLNGLSIKLNSVEENIRCYIEDSILKYENDNISMTDVNDAITMPVEEVILLAERWLDEKGLLPDNYIIQAAAVVKNSIDAYNNSAGETEIVSYILNFHQTYNGIPIVGKDEGVLIEYCNGGIDRVQYKCSDILAGSSPAIETADAEKEMISENEAVSIYRKYLSNSDRAISDEVVCRQAYYEEEGSLRLAWMFGIGDAFTEAVFVDASDGRIITK